MTPVCYLDMDGVLVDFVAGACQVHRSTLYLEPHLVTWDFWKTMGHTEAEFWAPMGFNFWADLNWTSEGSELLKRIEDIFGENVVLMTSPCDTIGSVEGKVEWIRRNCPTYSRRFFVGPPKHLTAAPSKLLVDDSDDNISKFKAAGGQAVLVPRPWNASRHLMTPGGGFVVADVLNQLRRKL